MMSVSEMNAIKANRTNLLKNLTREKAAGFIEDTPDNLRGVYLHRFLEMIDGSGPRMSEKWQNAAQITRSYRLGELPYGKRCAIAALLRYRWQN